MFAVCETCQLAKEALYLLRTRSIPTPYLLRTCFLCIDTEQTGIGHGPDTAVHPTTRKLTHSKTRQLTNLKTHQLKNSKTFSYLCRTKQLVGLSLAPCVHEESPGNTERPTS